MRIAVATFALVLAFVSTHKAAADESVTATVKELRLKGSPIPGVTPEVTAGLLVEGFWFHLTKDTVIIYADARRAALSDLRPGVRISARIASEIGQTDPPQALTDLIVIQTPRK